jgi:Carboxypeptidase regulatory-like domain
VKAYSEYDFKFRDAATVTDLTGALVGNAKLTIAEQNTVVSRSGQTNESRDYTFPDLPLGQYTVTARVTGLNAEIRHISLLVNTRTHLDFQLQLGYVAESVKVTGAVRLLETDLAGYRRQDRAARTAALPFGTRGPRDLQLGLKLLF